MHLKPCICLLRTYFIDMRPTLTEGLIGRTDQTVMFRKMKMILAQWDVFCVQRLSIFWSSLGWCHNSWPQPAFKCDLMELFGNCTHTWSVDNSAANAQQSFSRKTSCFSLKNGIEIIQSPNFYEAFPRGLEMVSCVTSMSLERGECRMLRNPPNQRAIVRKRLLGGLNLGKGKGRSGGITGFQTTLNTS